MKKAHLENNQITIHFPYTVITAMKLKKLQGLKLLHGKWFAPLTFKNVTILRDLSFNLDTNLNEYAQNYLSNIQFNASKSLRPIKIPNTKKQLFKYQQIGISFLEAKKGRGLIADEMGLGKTAQALSWLQLHQELRPAVIVVPASLKLNWKKEIREWINPIPKIQILSGIKANKPIRGEIIIVNYDILKHWLKKLLISPYSVVILDEIHYIKNSTALRAKAVKRLCKGIKHVIGLSGTPIENKPIELFNTLNLLNPMLFPNKYSFGMRYCNGKKTPFGWDWSGASNLDELFTKLVKNIMIRRKKCDVLTDLPPKIYSIVPIEIENKSEYDEAEVNFIHYLKKHYGKEAAERASEAEALTQISHLQILTAKGKLPGVMNWIDEFLESGEKLGLFCSHVFVVEEIMKRYKNIAVKIDGSVPTEKRQSVAERFQNDPNIKIFIGNSAAEVGLTLTAASHVAHIEFPDKLNPSKLAQRTDRFHRISQRFTVNVYYLIAPGTIDEKIADLMDKKQKYIDTIMDGKYINDEGLITDLIKDYL